MNNIELNHIDLNSIGLDSKQISGISKSYKHKTKPYIKGHVTDGSSTFTFKVNTNQSITVPVGADGKWKWEVDRKITSLRYCLTSLTNIDSIKLYGLNDLTSLLEFASAGTNEPGYAATALRVCDMAGCDLSGVVSVNNAFRNCSNLESFKFNKTLAPSDSANHSGTFMSTKITSISPSYFKRIKKLVDICYGCEQLKEADISQAELTFFRNTFQNSALETIIMGNVASGMEFSGQPFGSNLKNLSFAEGKTITGDFIVSSTSKLTEQSVVNLFNAVAADGITLTFHQNVWNMIMREIDVQGSQIQVAYQNMIDNYDVTIANASFDAEIEYLESNGTQYINTDAIVKSETIYDIKAQITQLQETAPLGGENFFIGAMSADSASYTLRCLVNGDNIIIQRGEFALNGVVFIPKDTNWHTYYNSKTLCKIDNTTGVPSYTITDNDLKIFLFKQNRGGSANKDSYCRIAYCKIWDGSTLVRDFIPVRKGATGYLYDKVSGNLFGNSGTGDFILGNDK